FESPVQPALRVLPCTRSGLFFFFFSSRRRHTRSVSAFLLNRSSDLLFLSMALCLLLRLFVFRLLRLKRFSTFSVKVLNLFSRSRRKTNKRKSKHSAMLRNKETRHRMFIGLLNTTRK